MKEKILLIELNEFNLDLLNVAVKELGLKNIRKILNFRHSKTLSDDNEEGQGLDPWVQWVSIHTGKPSNIHNVFRIGDIPKLELPQLWETLSENGISTGLWGTMNASIKNKKGCKFFLPDPWAFSESGYPNSLNLFLYLPRYYAKNYILPSKIKLIKGLFKFIFFFLRRKLLLGFIRESILSILIILRNGLKNTTLFVLFDMINTFAFLKYKSITNPDFSVIFLNSLAHLQHHFWNNHKITREMKMCLRVLDRIFGLLLNSKKSNETIVVINALSQRNVYKKGIYIYRQIDSQRFLDNVNIKYSKFEEGMTNDGHIFFDSKNDLDHAYLVLSDAKLNNKKMFYLEKDHNSKNEIFFQLNIKDNVNFNESFSINNRLLKFTLSFIFN